MVCARCGGFMVLEDFTDLREEIAQGSFVGGRCLNCGHIEDPVITGHRDAADPCRALVAGHAGGRSRMSKGPLCLRAGSVPQEA